MTQRSRSADRWHDLCVVRRADREEAEPDARRRGVRQLRDREGARRAARGHRRGVGDRNGARRPGTRPAAAVPATPADAAERPGAPESPGADPGRSTTRRRVLRDAAGRLRGADRAGARPGDGARRCSSTNWQWLSLTLAAPVVVWGAWPFHRAAAVNARHGAATMDTLISLGVLAAFGWSLYALFFGGAGVTGHDDVVRPACRSRAPARTRSTSRSAPRSRSSCWRAATWRRGRSGRPVPPCVHCSALAPRTSRCCGTASSRRVPIDRLAVGDEFVVRPGEKIATDGDVLDGSVRRGRQPADRRTGAGRGRPRATR